MKEFEVRFFEDGKETDYFIVDANGIEEAKEIAESLAHSDGVWSYDLEIQVARSFNKWAKY